MHQLCSHCQLHITFKLYAWTTYFWSLIVWSCQKLKTSWYVLREGEERNYVPLNRTKNITQHQNKLPCILVMKISLTNEKCLYTLSKKSNLRNYFKSILYKRGLFTPHSIFKIFVALSMFHFVLSFMSTSKASFFSAADFRKPHNSACDLSIF